MKAWKLLLLVVGVVVVGVALTVPRQQAIASPSGMKFEKLRCVEQQVTCWFRKLPFWTYWAKGTLLYDSGNPVTEESVTVTDGTSTKGPDTTDTNGKFAVGIPYAWAADTITAKAGTLQTNFDCGGNYVDCDGDGSCLPVDEVCAALGSVGGIAELPEIAGPEAAMSDTTSTNYAPVAGIASGGAVGVIMLATAAWYVRRRWLRHRA